MLDRTRFVLSDAMWERVALLLPGKAGDPGRRAADNRLFLEAVLWRVRTGSPWRDLPPGFGAWNSMFRRFRRLALAGIFERVFATLSDEPDLEWVAMDGTLISVHRSASGARGGPAPRRSGHPSRG